MRALTACALTAVWLYSLETWACGCFASTTTVNPVIQAGERIVFVSDGNQQTAYVQVKYTGEPSSFGWLVPVPSVPEVKVGTDELFEVLDRTTTPRFQLTTTRMRCGGGGGFGCGALPLSASGEGTQDAGAQGSTPLVLRDTTGPYEYAVLKADSRSELLAWLNANRFFVPGTSEAALAPYIRPGSYFLALKLRSGQQTGDLRPIVLKYTSDYPMIPLVLTSATAVPDMGIQVFVLADARAVPRNYHHVVVNPLKVDWNTAENYRALVTAAVSEAPAKHAFVTEYAGRSSIAQGQLVSSGRFGLKQALELHDTPESFVEALYANGFVAQGTSELPELVMNVLEKQIPYPPGLAERSVSRQEFYRDLRRWLSAEQRKLTPGAYADWPGVTYEGKTLAAEVWAAMAEPILEADAMLTRKPYLTRMFTTLSPEDMTVDPVFAINRGLPEVSAQHYGTRTTSCDGATTSFSADFYFVRDEAKLTPERRAAMPAASRVEQLPEEGAPTVLKEFQLDSSLRLTHGTAACAATDGLLGAVAGAWLLVHRLRRRRSKGTENSRRSTVF